ncbi:competence protein ComK, partial [Salipaludibacillus sp. CF4.18]|uniref:competence protein ComK n=1 Tax=Salipaludibacillus sp. CF4.18 TaxID=3373081 RepID=UPI003EE6B4AA
MDEEKQRFKQVLNVKSPSPFTLIKTFTHSQHSPTHFDCHWLFFAHIQGFTSPKNQPRQSIVTFSNGNKLLLPVS